MGISFELRFSECFIDYDKDFFKGHWFKSDAFVVLIPLSFRLVDQTKGKENVTINRNTYEFRYPCESKSECTDYEVKLPRGLYKFEAYGASGGIPNSGSYSSYINPLTKQCNQSSVDLYHGNTLCNQSFYSSGPGGYVSSILYLTRETKAYIMIGGEGQYGWKNISGNPFSKDIYIPGGYGGGAPARPNSLWFRNVASGGGRTALMMLKDDIFHSVLVSGGGGGCDDFQENNDGKGGAGGSISAQSFWIDGIYRPEFESNSSHFFTYGNGEAVIKGRSAHPQGSSSAPTLIDEYSGAGGGWFGGFSSYYKNPGSGGGSSFALTSDALIPTSMEVRNSFYEIESTGNYAFGRSSEFIMTHVVHSPGIWLGNGLFRITLNPNNPRECTCDYYINPLYSLLFKMDCIFLIPTTN